MKISWLSLVVFTASILSVRGTDYIWIATQPTGWTNGLAWEPAGDYPRTESDNATIAGGLSHALLNNESVTIGDLTLDSGAQLEISNNAQLTVFDAVIGDENPGAVLTVSGAAFTAQESIFVAQNASGSIQAENGAEIQAEVAIQLGINDAGIISLQDSSLSAPQISIDNVGSSLTLTGGSTLTTNNLQLYATGDASTPGLVVNTGSLVQILHDGPPATFLVATDTDAESHVLIAGGNLEIYNDNNPGNVTIGAGGIGSLTVTGGGKFQTDGGALVGSSFGSQGTVRITDAGSEWLSSGAVTVGPQGEGELILQNGGTARLEDDAFQPQTLILAQEDGSQGTLSIGGGLGEAAAAPGTLIASEVAGGAGQAVTRFNHTAGDYTFDTNLTGTLDLRVSAGVTTLTGTNTFSGTVHLEGGILALSSDSPLGNAANVLAFDGGILQVTGSFSTARSISLSSAGGTISVNPGVVATLSGTISGGSTLVKTGDGALELNPDTAAIGVLDIQAGTVKATASGDFGTVNTSTSVAASAALELPESGNLEIGSLSGAGTVRLNGSELAVYTHGNTVFSGVLEDGDLAGGSLAVHSRQAGSSVTLSGTVTYTGRTEVVEDGMLVVNTTYAETANGDVIVAAGATLGGDGVLRGEATIDGILAPGTSLGTLTIDNTVTWNGSLENAWKFELGPGDTSDLLVVGGDFLRGTGSAFLFDFVGTGTTGTYTLVSWSGTTNFTVSDFSAKNLAPGYSVSTFSINGSSLQVTVVPEPSVGVFVGFVAFFSLLVARRRLRREGTPGSC